MTSPRSFRANIWVSLALCLAALSTSKGFAQGGFGADPYRPYNQQYDSFVYPIAPGSGDVVPNEAAMGRAGMMRSNQYQEYLRGTFNPSYRTQRRLDPQAFRESQYQPNRKVDEESGYYEKQDYVSQAYFAYIRERDPKKRAVLLKDYQKARSRPSSDFSPMKSRRSTRKQEKTAGADDSSATASRLEKPSTALGRGTSAETPGTTSSTHPGDRATPGSSKPESVKPSDILEESLKHDSPYAPRTSRVPSPSMRRSGTTPPSRGRASGTRVPPVPPRRGAYAPSSLD